MRFRWCTTLFLLALVGHEVQAQTYPARPVRMIVPFAPGGTADIIGRPLAQRLGDVLRNSVVVDNRGGAGGSVGAILVANATPDGYTLLLGSSGAITIAPSLSKLNYSPAADFAPIGMVATSQFILVAHPLVPARNAQEIITLARSRPGAVRFASQGIGSVGHLAGELFKSLAKVDMIHVPYKGAGPMTVDLIAGQVDIGFPGLSSLVPHVTAGRVRALAVTGLRRSTVFPDLPTLDESGLPGYETTTFWGVLAPARTSRDIVQRLSAAVAEAARHAELRELYSRGGNDPATSTPEEFATRIRNDIAKWAQVVSAAGIKQE